MAVIPRALFGRPIALTMGFFAASTLIAQQKPAEQPAVTIRNSVRMVAVDVIAKDKHGHPVFDLEAEDFKLFDNGQPQDVRHVSVERRVAAEDSEDTPGAGPKPEYAGKFSNAHATAVVTTVILLDLLNTAPENQSSMKTELLKSLNHMREGTRIALLILGDDLTVVSDFTESSISLKNAAEAQLHERAEGFGPSITARKTGNPTRDAAILKATNHAFRAEDNQRTGRTLEALNLICHHLAGIPGRKNLIWLTGGLTASGQTEAVQDQIDRLNDANVAVYTVDARGVLLDPSVNAETDMNDLAGPIAETREENRGDVLGSVATGTGGIFYHNTNRLSVAIDQALEDNTVVYVIDYYPQHNRWDGKLHRLEVKTSRPGVRLRYRPSYRATPAPAPAQTQQQLLAAVESASMDFSGLSFSVDVKRDTGSDPVLLLHIPVDQLQWANADGNFSDMLQVWFVQKRAAGDDVFVSTWKSDLHFSKDQYQAATQLGLSVAGPVALQPVAAKVRVVLRDSGSGKIGTVDVPAESIKGSVAAPK